MDKTVKDQREKFKTFHGVSELMAVYRASFFVCLLEQRYKSHTNPGSLLTRPPLSGGTLGCRLHDAVGYCFEKYSS